MKSALQVVHDWIQMLGTGHVKLGTRELTKQEAEEVCIPLLQAIAADMEASDLEQERLANDSR